MGAPLIIPLLKRWHKWNGLMIWCGWSLCILGILAGSFTKTLPGLIITQGIMYGAGFVIFYYPIISLVNEFWVARRGMAYGLICSATGVSGIVMPFTLESLLHKYGYATTLRAVAVALVTLTGPLIPFLKGRIPVSETSVSAPTDWGFLRKKLFWIYTASNLMQGLGYFFPSLYLPSYATAVGLSSRDGAVLLAIMSVAQVGGQFSFGYLSDRKIPLGLLAAVSTTISATAAFAVWGLARSFTVLIVFALIYGFFGAGYSAMWGRMGTAVAGDTNAAFAAFGILNFEKGVGNVLAGPIGASLLVDGVSVKTYGAEKYEGIVLFTGSCMVASALSVCFSLWNGSGVLSRVRASQ